MRATTRGRSAGLFVCGARLFLTLLCLLLRPVALVFSAFFGYPPMSLIRPLLVPVFPARVLSWIVGHGDEVSA